MIRDNGCEHSMLICHEWYDDQLLSLFMDDVVDKDAGDIIPWNEGECTSRPVINANIKGNQRCDVEGQRIQSKPGQTNLAEHHIET